MMSIVVICFITWLFLFCSRDESSTPGYG